MGMFKETAGILTPKLPFVWGKENQKHCCRGSIPHVSWRSRRQYSPSRDPGLGHGGSQLVKSTRSNCSLNKSILDVEHITEFRLDHSNSFLGCFDFLVFGPNTKKIKSFLPCRGRREGFRGFTLSERPMHRIGAHPRGKRTLERVYLGTIKRRLERSSPFFTMCFSLSLYLMSVYSFNRTRPPSVGIRRSLLTGDRRGMDLRLPAVLRSVHYGGTEVFSEILSANGF